MAKHVIAALLIVVGAAGIAGAQSGIQITRDGKRTLISKDVGNQRWAITLNDDGMITGNVFDAGGGTPKFLDCRQLRRVDPNLFLGCSVADRCETAACPGSSWMQIRGEVSLPVSFFKPVGAVSSVTAIADEILEDATSSGLQITPDLGRVLVSKDVGNERWAITRHLDDKTVTGNVFSGPGSAPKFVWCAQTAESGSEVSLRCFGADACRRAPCTSEQWIEIGPVRLPLPFFAPPGS